MASILRSLALLALLTTSATLTNAGASGSGTTTRYWDCCKGSCAWSGKAPVTAPVKTCDKDNNPLSDANAKSGCEAGGNAYMCADQSPWAVSDTLAYGFAAVNVAGQTERDWCCSCYKLTFTSDSMKGKQMIVQATNTGGDLGGNQFDIAIPGGGVGVFNACSDQYGAPPNGWGKQYGGIDTNTCSSMPACLQPGCNWRFDWFADNPSVDFEQVACPAEIVAKTGCGRSDELPLAPGFSNPTSSSSAAVSNSVTSSSQAVSSSAVSTSSVAAYGGADANSQSTTSQSSSTFATSIVSGASSTTTPGSSSTASSTVGPSTTSLAASAGQANGDGEDDEYEDTCEL
ncbi:MAG: hypothetical protein M1812_003525 [Candelaria pacifica]|nr:MAG: hypothetical protein M1812_003525 [Candelaria pacifica]